MLEAGFAALDEGVVIFDGRGKVIACNPAATRISGRTADELLGASPAKPGQEVRLVDGTVMTERNSLVYRVLETHEPERGVIMQFVQGGTGENRWVRANYQPLGREGEERPWGVVCSFVDITAERDRAESTMQEFSRQVRAFLGSQGSAMLYVKDPEGRFLFASPAFARAFAVARAEVVGKSLEELLPADLAEACRESDRRALAERTVVEAEEPFTENGGTRVFHTVKFPLLDDSDEPYAIVGVSIDITDRKRAESDLRAREEVLTQFAFHDALTGLANRRLFEEHLQVAMARARRNETALGLLFLDVDNLKHVNDTHGHAFGDELLRQIGARIDGTLRASDILARQSEEDALLARHGGDEFLLLLADLQTDPRAAVETVARHVEEALAPPFEVKGTSVRAGVSFGTAVYPDDGQTPEALLGCADSSMYRMKARRGGDDPGPAGT